MEWGQLLSDASSPPPPPRGAGIHQPQPGPRAAAGRWSSASSRILGPAPRESVEGAGSLPWAPRLPVSGPSAAQPHWRQLSSTDPCAVFRVCLRATGQRPGDTGKVTRAPSQEAQRPFPAEGTAPTLSGTQGVMATPPSAGDAPGLLSCVETQPIDKRTLVRQRRSWQPTTWGGRLGCQGLSNC